MGNIAWTKSWSASDNGTVFGGVDLQSIQNDITTVVNGGITNSNIKSDAGIVESKLAFNTSTGHTHDGSDSRAIALPKHYRKGLALKKGSTPDSDIVVTPGLIDVGGVALESVADSSDLDLGSETFLAGTTGTDQYIYVYAYDDSNTLSFKLSTEAPDLAFDDDTTAEYPLRYQKYSTTYYRCVGAVYQDAAGDLCWGQASSEGLFVTNFDASPICIIGGLGDGSDQTFNTIWTPKDVCIIYGYQDTTPVATDKFTGYEVVQLMLDSDWQSWVGAVDLNAEHGITADNEHRWVAVTTPGTVNAITPQSVGTSGSFTIDAMDDDEYFYAVARTDGFQA